MDEIQATELFAVQDFAKQLLLESKNEKAEDNARSLIDRTIEELKKLHV